MFSVVAPVYNHGRYLEHGVMTALRSPLVREVLLVDDGSHDDSRERIADLAARFPDRVRDLTRPDEGNCGAHARLDQLVEASRADWIAVLNSDDAFTPDRFELLRAHIRARRDLEFACGHLLVIDETGATRGTKRGVWQPEYPFPRELDVERHALAHDLVPLLANQNFIATTSNMVFTRALHLRVGGFRPYRYVHDWDFAIRASVLAPCAYLQQFLTLYRNHDRNSIKTDPSRIEAEVRQVFAELRSDFPEVWGRPEVEIAVAGNRYLGAEAAAA